MTLRKRIVLIACGLAAFLLLAPLIVLMAQGYRYDFENGQIIVTGALVVKTEPRGASVILSGKDVNDTPLTKRFLIPGEYEMELRKAEYRPWRKRINIFERQVTFLPNQSDKINLLLENIETLKTQDGVSDILAYEDAIFFINSAGIFRTAFGSGGSELVATTTPAFSTASFVDGRRISGRAEFILRAEGQDWYIASGKRFALPPLAGVQFANSASTILGLDNQKRLVEIGSQKARVLKENVLSFRRNGDQIYCLIQTISGEFQLQRTIDGSQTTDVAAVPAFQKSQIILSADNQVFLLLDRDLYSVKDSLMKINSNVDSAYWDIHGNFLLYGNDYETWAYEPLGTVASTLLLRTTVPAASPLYHKRTSYIFLIEGQEIKAIESDGSGQPNAYVLLAAAGAKKISLNEEGDILGLLDGQSLKLMKLR